MSCALTAASFGRSEGSTLVQFLASIARNGGQVHGTVGDTDLRSWCILITSADDILANGRRPLEQSSMKKQPS